MPPSRASARRWRTALNRERRQRAQRVVDYQLSPRQLHALLASGRQVPMATMARAMGMRLPAPHLNPSSYVITNPPRRRNPMAKAKRKSEHQQAAFDFERFNRMASAVVAAPPRKKGGRKSAKSMAKKKEAPVATKKRKQGQAARARKHRGQVGAGQMGWFSAPRNLRKGGAHGRKRAVKATDLRTRKQFWADEFGNPIVGRDAWRGFYKPGSGSGGGKKKSGKKKGRTAAQRAATKKMLAANRARGGGKKKGKKSGKKKGGRTAAQRAATKKMLAANRARQQGKGKARKGGRRMPSRQQIKALIRKWPKKTEVRVFTRTKRGKKIPGYVLRNPAGGRHMASHTHRRRRNPSFDIMGMAKRTIAAAIPSVAGGAIISIVDAKLLANQSLPVRIGGKVAAAVVAGLLLRSRPDTARLMMGSILGTLGYELGTKLNGGILAPTKTSGLAQLAWLLRADPQAMNALIDASGQPQTVPNLQGMGAAPAFGSPDPSLG